ncbi:MAG: hypothetical protein O4861_06335 [Trichodesmium sp. St16_bin4-tuft]|nr:hypothetical protein [Trichodesmium sp. St4_bin8_1]MDE5071402.1 hypothetical protein [Trichodesmium sp. St5_bin8]MDE5097971.1 hypothetical protein [Trichodesmium sp. St16_bin4-tuft]MDE5102126.1 hypothetical protein [Trichodesmium sp. St19_bin2]
MSLEIKEENKEKARKRIFVEHIIRLIKIFGIVRAEIKIINQSTINILISSTKYL